MSFLGFAKIRLSIAAALALLSFASKDASALGQVQEPVAVPAALKSRLDQSASLPNFGSIAYRGPRLGNGGPSVVLFHGVYGGSSHLSFRQLIDALDAQGARVYVMDLPGTGESDYHRYKEGVKLGIRRQYTAKLLENFVVDFTQNVVKEPSILVGQATISMSVLAASKRLEDLAKAVVLLSPSGVNVLSEPPTLKQKLFGGFLRTFESKLNDFYRNELLSDENILNSVANGLYDKHLVDETFLAEFRLGRNYLNQKWISLSFIEGRLSYPFRVASAGVTKPVLMLFGKEDVGIAVSDGAGSINNVSPDREADFAALRPDLQYVTIPSAASIIWEEKPEVISAQILGMNDGL